MIKKLVIAAALRIAKSQAEDLITTQVDSLDINGDGRVSISELKARFNGLAKSKIRVEREKDAVLSERNKAQGRVNSLRYQLDVEKAEKEQLLQAVVELGKASKSATDKVLKMVQSD